MYEHMQMDGKGKRHTICSARILRTCCAAGALSEALLLPALLAETEDTQTANRERVWACPRGSGHSSQLRSDEQFQSVCTALQDMRVTEKPRPLLHGLSLLSLWRQVSSGGACRGELAA